jgi:hypothetical protein
MSGSIETYPARCADCDARIGFPFAYYDAGGFAGDESPHTYRSAPETSIARLALGDFDLRRYLDAVRDFGVLFELLDWIVGAVD